MCLYVHCKNGLNVYTVTGQVKFIIHSIKIEPSMLHSHVLWSL